MSFDWHYFDTFSRLLLTYLLWHQGIDRIEMARKKHTQNKHAEFRGLLKNLRISNKTKEKNSRKESFIELPAASSGSPPPPILLGI